MAFIEQQLSSDGVNTFGRFVASEAIYQIITNPHVASMVLNSGGSGYAVGDLFRLNAGTPVQVNGDDFHATGRVTAVGSPASGGVVTAVEIVSWGAYTGLPTVSPVTSPEGFGAAIPTTTLTGAGDDALTVDVTSDAATWTSDSLVTDSPLTTYEWLCSSTKAANGATIGMRANSGGGANDALRMTIGSSYSGILPWTNQPGVPATNNFYIAVPQQNPKLYVSVTERRVNVLATDGTYKQYAGVGLFLPFLDVDSNYPFPGLIHAQSTAISPMAETYPTDNRGICNPIDFSGLGCYQYRNNLSTEWFGITYNNSLGGDTCRAQMWPANGTWAQWALTHAPVPTGSSAPSTQMDPELADHATMYFEEGKYFGADQVSAIGPCGPAPLGLSSQTHFTVQSHIISNQSGDVQLIGYIDGFENIHGRGLTAFDEIQNQDGRRYIVFNDTQSGDLTHWVAMEMI